jgi:hypothetical protein
MTQQPCAPALRRLWAEGAPGRQSWALSAYDRFCSELSPWTRDSLPAARDETTIVLFGPTQVGKTTLLLELLGVAKNSLPYVNDVLRGGRKAGLSATATPMIYDDSLGECWRLDHGGQAQDLDADGLKQALTRIRGRVEAGLADIRPATLYIPARYFNANRRGTPRVRILDLPGVNPANANEAEHVRRVARDYVPTADLVLLITRADDLGFLQPLTLTAQGLRALDWTVSPARFCLVTSFAFTLGTLQSWLAAPGETRDVAALRSRLAEQMRCFDMEVEDPRILYPLDFGNSWAQTPVERRAKVQPLMAELRRELRARIAETAQELGRLRHARNAYHVAVKVQETELARHNRAQEGREKELKRKAGLIAGWCQQRGHRRERMSALPDAEATDQARQNLQVKINKLLDNVRKLLPAVDNKDAMKKSCLLRLGRQFRMNLWDCVSKLETLDLESHEEWEILRRVTLKYNEFSKHSATFFTEFDRQLDSYRLEDYWLLVPGRNFAKDLAWLSVCMEQSRVWTQSKLGEACDSATRERQAIVARERKRMSRRLQRVQARIKRLEAERTELKAENAKRAEEAAAIERELDEDKTRAAEFNALLRAALHDDLRTRREAIAKEPVPARRFLRLLEAVAVCDRAHSLLGSSPTTTEATA